MILTGGFDVLTAGFDGFDVLTAGFDVFDDLENRRRKPNKSQTA